MLTILIHDTDKTHAHLLRQMVKAHCLLRRCPVQLTTHTTVAASLEALRENPHQFDILLVSAADPDAACRLARTLRAANLAATLLFFSTDTTFLGKLIPWRMSGFLRAPVQAGPLASRLDSAIAEQPLQPAFLVLSGRFGISRYPLDSIECMRSEGHHVRLRLRNREEEPAFQTRLDEVERLLPSAGFLRCHQSFLVNLRHVMSLDRRRRCLVLASGFEVPISKRGSTEVMGRCIAHLEASGVVLHAGNGVAADADVVSGNRAAAEAGVSVRALDAHGSGVAVGTHTFTDPFG